MAKKYNSRKNEKTDGEQKTNGIAAMFDKLVEYAKIIESSDWKMGWKTNLNAWRGMPQNISGREYTGGNSFYLMLATMANNYTMPVYATFNQINKLNEKLMDDKGRIPKDKWAQAVHVKKGEQSDYAIFTTIQYKNKENPKEKALTREEYQQLPKEEQEKYEEKWINYAHPIFNVDQTNMSEVKPELYEKLKERMGIEQRQNFLQNTEGMYAEPAIDYILQNQTWRCPVNFTQESRGAFYSPGMDQITIPMKEQFNVPYEQKDLEKDVEKLVKPALTAKPAIENFSDADRNLSLLKENNNKEYKTELRATLMLENTFGMQLGILRQDGQSLNDYARQIDKAIKDNPENIIAIKNQEAKIVGGKDFYATFIHEGAHSMGKELNINLNETGDKKGYAREELRAESSAGIIAATMGYGNSILFNSAAYIRGWNETASVGEKTKQMKQLQIDINSTVKRMGEMIDDAAIKAGVQPIFDKSFAEKQKTNQTTQTPAQTPADLQSVGNKVGDLQSPSQTTEPKVSQQTTAQPTQNEQTVVPSVAVTQQQNEQATQPMESNNNAKSQSTDELTPRQKLEAIGYPYSSQRSEDGTFNIPTVNESLYWRYAAGIISLHEAAQEFTKNGWTNFVDEDYTRKQFAEINQKWHKLDDDLQPLAPEQTKNTAKQYAPLEDDPKMSLAEPISGQYSSSPSPKADGQSSAVEQQQNLSPAEQPIASNDKTVTQSLLQQAEEFQKATGIQLEVQGDRLNHKGDLNLFKTNIQQLPENLTVEGNLDIHASNIKELPKNLTVNGDLDLGYTPITKLPENLSVGGGLWLDGTKIERLPDNLVVGGSLNLAETPITKLPNNLSVGGWLDLTITPIKELPADLKVKKGINLNDRTIKANPDIMSPDGYIDLVKAGAPIQQNTQSLQQQIANFKEATGIQLEIQGDKLVHNGDLDLSKTNIERLPNNLTVKGSLDISDTPIKELPKNLTVENGLWLENTKIERLPEDLTVESTLSLYNTPVKELPENLTVKGNLWLDDSDIQRLPDNFKVNGFLDLSNTPIKELPQNLTVEGSLVIYNTAIKELPDNLSVGGNIYMNGRTIEANSDILTKDGYIDLVKAGAPIQQTDAPSVATSQQQNLSPAEQPITSITSMASIDNKTSQSLLQQAEEFQKATGIQLEVQGGRLVYDKTLDLRNTSITELPENLTVKGNLNLAETPIKELPKDLSVGGSLWLANTNVDKLPENLTVGGDLNLSHTPIKQLPDGLSVGGSLALSKTEIEELPKDLSVGGGLYLNNTQIKSLPDNLTVNGSLWLDDNPNIERLPNNLTVKGDLDLNGTNIKELPNNLTVDGGLWIQYSKIEKLPDNLTVGGSLYIKEEQAEEIPNNLKVGGPLVVDGNEISVKPNVLTPDGYLDLEKAILQEENEQEDVWHKLSALLMNTNEDIHLVAKEDDILVLETGEEVGLSDLEKIQLSEVWRNPSDESIHYKTRSDDEEYDLSNNTVFIRQIYNYVANGEMMMKDIAAEQQINHTAEQQNAQPMDPIDNNNNQQTQDAKYVPVDNLANENDQYAVVKSHDGRGGYEHQIMSYQEAEEIVENRPFHYIEWSGDMQQLLKDADKVTFEDHLEVNHEEPRDYPVTLAELAIEKDIIKDKLEDTWHKLSALLMDTSEDIHLITKENDILVLETNQDMGLSDLEKNRLSEVWQHPTEGYITFKLEGSDQEFDLSEYPELIPQIYNHVVDGEMMMKDVAAEQQVSQNIEQDTEQKAVLSANVEQQQNLSPVDTLQQQIADFKEATGIQLEVRDGKPFYNNDLNLYGVNIEKLPDNLTVKGNLGLDSTLIKELAENLKVSGNLNLNGTQIERLPDGLSVRGSLYLEFSKIERLPENLTVGEHLDLRNTPIKQLPDNLTVGGWLDLRETPITELPNNLSVRGDLYLNDTKIKQLPENLTIKGDLWLNNTNIERLPENLTVEGNLHLANTPIKELPDNLTVKGSLDISDTNITKLPENLTVNGSLNLENTPIKELPENLTIKGYLDLDGSQIKRLPENFTVEGNLYLSKTQIERLPENLTVGGSLWLNETNIESLPENLAVEGDLRLENTNIQKLPENLTVEKNLSLKNTQVEQLPENLSVRGWLDLTNTPVKELPENLSVGGSLLLGNTNIKELQNNLTFKENLDLENTPIKELPDNLTVGGSLWLNGTNIEKLPENLTVNGNLDLGDTPIKELPDNLTVNGDLDLDGSSIKKLPENLTVEGRLDLINTSVTELPADLKVKNAIRMDDRTIEATPDVMSPDGYIDLVKANAPIQQASQKADSPSMDESPTAKEYAIMWMTSIAEKTPKDRPSDIVFVKDFSLEDPTKPIYEVYGKDADRLAEKISSSVVTMRPEIEGQRYPNATVNSGNIEAVRADLMINNVHPVIIDLEGNRITNDKTLDYTKEERKAFLDSLKPEAKQRQDIAETIQRLGNPDKIVVPQLYNSHSVYAGPELAVPHRFGYQEVPVLQLVKSKNGSYRAGNGEDGYYPIAKMDTNNLYEVQKALKIVENNRPQKLIEELQKQVESGKASVEKDLAENHYKFTIYDQQGDLYYPRGNKSFTLNTKENDKIYLHPDNANYVTEHKVDPQLVKKMTAYAESKLGIQQNQDNGMAVATAQQQKGPDQKNQAQDTTTSQQQSPKDNVQKTQQQNAWAQQPKQGEKDAVKLTDLEVVGRQDKYFISVKANGVSLPTKQISIDDFKDFKTKKIDEQQLVNKYYSKELAPKQEQSQSHKRGR